MALVAIFNLFLLVVSFKLAFGQPSISPARDQFVASTSDNNITYTCLVDAGRSVVWEVGRSQIRSSTQFADIAAIGIFIDPMDTTSANSTLTVTSMARDGLDVPEIMVSCLSISGIDSIPGETFTIFNFFPPDAPSNLDLITDGLTLTLQWDRPTNVPAPVIITYIIDINSTENSELMFQNGTTMTSLSIHFLEELLSLGQCVMFDFFVRGFNEAGFGPSVSIRDTVPISPDVTNVSRDLTVDMVDLQPLSAQISFPPVIPCSSNFLLHNYTIEIDGVTSRLLLPADIPPLTSGGMIRPTLSGTQLTPDSSFSLTVTACNEVTCRTSNATTLYTTDVQRANILFFQNRVFINCSFAVNSQALGCVVVLTLTGTNDTERLMVAREGGRSFVSMCGTADNQKEAYNRVEVFDLEADGGDGSLGINITSSTIVLEDEGEYIELTGCREPTDNTAAIVGGVIGGIFALVLIGLLIAGIVVGVTTGWWCGIMELEEVENLLKPRRVESDHGDVEEGRSDTMAMSALAPSVSSGPPPPPTDHAASSPVEVHDAPLLGAAPPAGGGKEGKAVKPPQKQTSIKRSKSTEPKSKLERKKYVLLKTEHVMPYLEQMKKS